ncbi:hypothetical protein V1508DRAFT_399401 [Lipomyces doorenjongii]|uniref:uncharacterized protein n=1 Tax=Lipomyces doorenjongii TaxID=383834 RepID=UPI0034CE2C63
MSSHQCRTAFTGTLFMHGYWREWGKVYRKAFGATQMNQPLSVLTGATAGATEAFVVVPFELVKIRLQDKVSGSLYKSLLDVAIKIVRNEGILAIYNGLEFGVIFKVRELMPKAETPSGQTMNDLIAGTIGGTAGTIPNTPSSANPMAGGQYSLVLLVTEFKEWSRGLSYATDWIPLAGLLCVGDNSALPSWHHDRDKEQSWRVVPTRHHLVCFINAANTLLTGGAPAPCSRSPGTVYAISSWLCKGDPHLKVSVNAILVSAIFQYAFVPSTLVRRVASRC